MKAKTLDVTTVLDAQDDPRSHTGRPPRFMPSSQDSPACRLLPMSNPRLQLLARVLLGSAVVMLLLGLYFLLVLQQVVIGAVLLVVAVTDVVMALVFSRRAT